MARKKRSRNQVDDLVDTAAVLPNGQVAHKARKRYVLMRRLLILSLLLAPLNLAGLFASANLAFNGIAVATDEADASKYETGRTEAESSLQTWLDSEKSPLAGSEISSWDGVSDVASVEATDQEVGYRLMTHDFTIRTRDGVYYRAAVRTAYTPTRGVKVLATPTITPVEPTAVTGWEPIEPMDGWESIGAPEAANSTVTSWATALVSSPEDLKLAVRDGDPSHAYASLSGVTLQEASIAKAWSPRDRQGEVDTSTLVASVNIVIADPDDAKVRTTIQYDVLIRGADTAAPYVTAWGPTGSGTTLTDYENAVSLDGEVDGGTPAGPAASDGGGDQPQGSTDDPAAPELDAPAAEGEN